MEWVDRLNRTIAYMEDHLTGEIDCEALARLACCSAYHYQRMFSCMAGVSLSEYIRRRRMSLAAVDLRAGERVLDVGLKYGYQSPTAFNRAFQAVHGIPPSAVREPGAAVKSFPPLRFTISIKGAEEMEYRIETRESFRIVGVSIPIEKDMERNFQVVPALWDRVAADGTLQRLVGLMDGVPMGILGVCDCPDGGQWRYYVAAASSREAAGLEEYAVPAATWAIFHGEGAVQSIQELERRILTEWLPSSGYEYGNAPDIEVYLNPDPANAKYEVWIPVVRKGCVSKKWLCHFFERGFATLCASVVRQRRTIRRSLRAKCFSHVHAAGKTISFYLPPAGGKLLRRAFLTVSPAAPLRRKGGGGFCY